MADIKRRAFLKLLGGGATSVAGSPLLKQLIGKLPVDAPVKVAIEERILKALQSTTDPTERANIISNAVRMLGINIERQPGLERRDQAEEADAIRQRHNQESLARHKAGIKESEATIEERRQQEFQEIHERMSEVATHNEMLSRDYSIRPNELDEVAARLNEFYRYEDEKKYRDSDEFSRKYPAFNPGISRYSGRGSSELDRDIRTAYNYRSSSKSFGTLDDYIRAQTRWEKDRKISPYFETTPDDLAAGLKNKLNIDARDRVHEIFKEEGYTHPLRDVARQVGISDEQLKSGDIFPPAALLNFLPGGKAVRGAKKVGGKLFDEFKRRFGTKTQAPTKKPLQLEHKPQETFDVKPIKEAEKVKVPRTKTDDTLL
jgi:hypothetical protein